MSKVRVYEVAKQLNLEPKAVVALFQTLGVTDVRNHMSSVDADAVERVKRHLEKQKTHDLVEERIRPTVVKRRAVAKAPDAAPSKPDSIPADTVSGRALPMVDEDRPSARVLHEAKEVPEERVSVHEVAAPPVTLEARKSTRVLPSEAPSARSLPTPEPSAPRLPTAAPEVVEAAPPVVEAPVEATPPPPAPSPAPTFAEEMAAAGFTFFRTPNDVWLVEHVPPQFLIFP